MALRGSVRLALNQDAADLTAKANARPAQRASRKLSQAASSAGPAKAAHITQAQTDGPGLAEVNMVRTELRALGRQAASEADLLDDVTKRQDGLVDVVGALSGDLNAADLRATELKRTLDLLNEKYTNVDEKRMVQAHERRVMQADISSFDDYVGEFRSWIGTLSSSLSDSLSCSLLFALFAFN
jgi:chromosome segregation ATPase